MSVSTLHLLADYNQWMNARLYEAASQLTPQALDEQVYTDLPHLWQHRQRLDQAILTTVHALTNADLDHALDYFNMKNEPQRKLMFGLMLHFFNHQTHHRGQVTTLLTQAGVDVGSTDLLTRIQPI